MSVASAANAAWLLALTCALTGLWACQSLAAREPQPAVLTNPSTQSLAEIREVVSQALNGAPVRLAPDALTHDSELIIERSRPRDALGRPLNGRELGRPEHFRLLKRGSQCILVQERTGKHWVLHSVSCAINGL